LSHSYLRNVRFSPTREQDLVEAEAAAERAMTLDPRSSFSHLAMGCVRYERRRMNEARAAFEYSIALNPNEPHAHASLGAANIMLARPEEALQPLRRAMTLSPRDPTFGVWQMFTRVAHLHLGRDAEAVEWLSKSANLNPTDPFAHLFLASALALSGRKADAEGEIAELRRLSPEFTTSRFKAREPSNEPSFLAQRERIFEGLRLAGAPV
jgi:Flp pilus assembly protein TadD